MPLIEPRSATAPERIMVYGGPGSGKSSCWIDIAQKLEEAGQPGRVVVIDSDNAVEAMFGEGYANLTDRITNFKVFDWNDLRNASNEIQAMNLTREDWLIHDMISFPYTEVRRHYTALVHGKDLESYLLETAMLVNQAKQRRLEDKNAKGHERQFGGWNSDDWDYMGKIYLDYEVPLTLKMNCHVMAIAEEREVDTTRGASSTQVKKYLKVGGHKPYVNNTAEHRFRTVLRITNPGINNREIMAQKDRYREQRWDDKAFNNTIDVGDMNADGGFVRNYLVQIARWRLRQSKDD